MSRRAEAAFALYLLIHPERYPTNDWSAIVDGHDEDAETALREACNFDAAYGVQIVAATARAERSVVLLDPSDVESLFEDGEDLLDGTESLDALKDASQTPEGRDALLVGGGAPLVVFDEVLEGDPGQIKDVLAHLVPPQPGAKALLGGFARHDCVKRAAQVLRGRGWQVEICEMTTLPLKSQGLWRYIQS